ncbi:hypothetical protein ROHU_006373 [Labeo rohita]|uniref:Uncharacterized protein n=1 Tax=Labeo rohita TaxID=84645 RepID=A0A498MUB6_LABRO|nr:hypothetical protein ROHU_006373 [Labeo rohita]
MYRTVRYPGPTIVHESQKALKLLHSLWGFHLPDHLDPVCGNRSQTWHYYVSQVCYLRLDPLELFFRGFKPSLCKDVADDDKGFLTVLTRFRRNDQVICVLKDTDCGRQKRCVCPSRLHK